MTEKGLGEVWDEVIQVLSKVVPVYDEMNRVMSFGKDLEWRLQGLRSILKPHDLVLDAGCGPGVMSELALSLFPDLRIHLLDPLDVMLEAAKARVTNPACSFVRGYFEDMQFPDAAFDVVMCGFSIRDARNLDRALSEIHRVLKPNGGRLLIVDLGKPDNRLMRWLIGFYWRYIVPLMAFAKIGKKGLLYSVLYKTYKRHPTNGQLKAKLQSIFMHATLLTEFAGGVVIITCSK